MTSDRNRTPTPGPNNSVPPPSVFRPSRILPGRSATGTRIIEIQTLARVLYQYKGASYLRIRCEDEYVHLIDMDTNQPLRLPKRGVLTKKDFERMIAEKIIVRRLYVGDNDAFNTALSVYFRTGAPLGEFVTVNAVRLIPNRHLSSTRRFTGKRFKRLP